MERTTFEITIKAQRTTFGGRLSELKIRESIILSLEDLMLQNLSIEIKEVIDERAN